MLPWGGCLSIKSSDTPRQMTGSAELSLRDALRCRAVQVAMQDCRFAFDLASRDAIWGAAEHMAAGAAPFKKPPFQAPSPHNKVTRAWGASCPLKTGHERCGIISTRAGILDGGLVSSPSACTQLKAHTQVLAAEVLVDQLHDHTLLDC